jgi:periplasmic divalent cation tolerance protein
MKKDELILILTTFAQLEEAKACSQQLLELRLIACATLLPETESMYLWNDTIEIAKEVQVIFKTIPKNIDTVFAICKELHSYELPEFIVIDSTQSSTEYTQWLQNHCSQTLQ